MGLLDPFPDSLNVKILPINECISSKDMKRGDRAAKQSSGEARHMIVKRSTFEGKVARESIQ